MHHLQRSGVLMSADLALIYAKVAEQHRQLAETEEALAAAVAQAPSDAERPGQALGLAEAAALFGEAARDIPQAFGIPQGAGQSSGRAPSQVQPRRIAAQSARPRCGQWRGAIRNPSGTN